MKLLFLICYLAIMLSANAVTITVEHAVTPQQCAWGLMQRRHLPPNHGMTFNYPYAERRCFRSFNCMIDLSVAFLDDNKVIQEIRHLPAHYHMMDPRRPVRSPSDFDRYPPNDPIVRYFDEHSVVSQQSARYVLEMAAGWFEENGVQVGDRVIWEIGNSKAEIEKGNAENQGKRYIRL